MKKFLVIFLTALTLFSGCDILDEGKYDLTELDAKIAEANLALEGVDTAENESDVATGRKFVTEDDMKKFTDAIASAELVRVAPISQNAVNSAIDTLDTAIYRFKSKLGTGTKASGFNQNDLSKLIKEAENAKVIVKTSANGADISPKEYWVVSATMTALTTAISGAKSETGTVDSKYTPLNTALNSLNSTKKLGTATSWRSITITGLNTTKFPNGTEIGAGLSDTANIDLSARPQIYGNGLVSRGMATVVFYSNNTLWTGDGSYYVVLMLDETKISKSKITFSSTDPNPSAKYLDFNTYAYVYEYKCGDLASAAGFTITSNGTSLNNFCIRITGSGYAELIASGTLPASLYKDSGLSPTQAFLGIETIYTDTKLYCVYDLKMALGLQ